MQLRKRWGVVGESRFKIQTSRFRIENWFQLFDYVFARYFIFHHSLITEAAATIIDYKSMIQHLSTKLFSISLKTGNCLCAMVEASNIYQAFFLCFISSGSFPIQHWAHFVSLPFVKRSLVFCFGTYVISISSWLMSIILM